MSNETALTTAAQTYALTDSTAALVGDWHTHLDRLAGAGDLSAASVATYRRGLARFLDWCIDHAHPTIDSALLLDWKASEKQAGSSPAAINTWLAGVRAFYGWAVGAGRLTYNPTAGVKGAKRRGTSQGHKRDSLTNQEARRVLAIPDTDTPAGRRDAAIIALMLYTGVRTIEVHRADYADLKNKAGQLVLYVQGKGQIEANEYVVISHPEAQQAIHNWLSIRGGAAGPLFVSLSNRSYGGALSTRAIRKIIKDAFRLAGVVGDRKTTHSLRHTAITSAIRGGATVQKAGTMARHKSLNTTLVYFHELDRLQNPAEGFISYDD